MTLMTAEKIPYDAKHVIYVDHGYMVRVLWTSNPVKAANPERLIATLHERGNDDVEVVATLTRFYKKDGAGFSGWLTESQGYPSDPIPNKREGMRQLRMVIAEYFKR
ncbi:hypothetical protein [Acrocarpospora sp. B8E8]|uniref:hypothetical protein n=1 Tax=Acrocarpospora sp. B8E8 TaxID=3153572 RepID=UPI00325C37BF